jgi:hypothetical protein
LRGEGGAGVRGESAGEAAGWNISAMSCLDYQAEEDLVMSGCKGLMTPRLGLKMLCRGRLCSARPVRRRLTDDSE